MRLGGASGLRRTILCKIESGDVVLVGQSTVLLSVVSVWRFC